MHGAVFERGRLWVQVRKMWLVLVPLKDKLEEGGSGDSKNNQHFAFLRVHYIYCNISYAFIVHIVNGLEVLQM